VLGASIRRAQEIHIVATYSQDKLVLVKKEEAEEEEEGKRQDQIDINNAQEGISLCH
jgi:hypothetical protein